MYRGVFCIEGEWNHTDLSDRSSVNLLLETLSQVETDFEYIYRRVAKKEELDYYLKKWLQKKYQRYGVLSLAMHGEPRTLELAGDRNKITLADLEKTIAGGGKGRVVYFGSCDTLDVSESEIKNFKKNTKVDAVIGYRETVEWIESAAFEMLLFNKLQYYKTLSVIEKRLREDYKGLSEKLGLVFVS